MAGVKVLGISGGSGSGKTTLARALMKHFGPGHCVELAQDHYYIDQSKRFDGDGGSVNFDHPSSIEFSLLARHIAALKAGLAVEVPIYDFATHSRKAETTHFKPAPLIVIDGTLIFSQPDVLAELHHSVFVRAPEADRYARRLKRDVEERGRTAEGVQKQFLRQVKPMHDEFIEPSQGKAMLCVSGLAPIEESLKEILKLLA